MISSLKCSQIKNKCCRTLVFYFGVYPDNNTGRTKHFTSAVSDTGLKLWTTVNLMFIDILSIF